MWNCFETAFIKRLKNSKIEQFGFEDLKCLKYDFGRFDNEVKVTFIELHFSLTLYVLEKNCIDHTNKT